MLRLFISLCKVIPKALRQLYQWLVKRLYFSISFKITAVYAVIFGLIFLLFNAGIGVAFVAYLGRDAQEDLVKDFEIISSLLKDNTELPARNIEQLSRLDGIEITLFTEKKEVIYTTEETSPVFYEQKDNRFFVFNTTPTPYGKSTSPLTMVLNDPVIWNSNTVYIQITNPLARETFNVGLLMAALFSLTMVMIIIVIVIGSRASKKMLLPVAKMTNTVNNITINALDTRLDVGGSQDELKDLAKTFNSMLDRIQLSYEQQNQFVSDASHELRTPIAVIQGYANLLDRWGKNDPSVLEESITSIKTESENMKDLIEKLLFLARGDKATQKIDKESFSIQELMEEIIKETRLIDPAHEIINWRNENMIIFADRKLLKEALRSLIDNSIKYTPKGGKIIIDYFSQKSQAVITITDTGIGISKEDLPYIFNRFYRADKSRTKQTGGTGLGLSIARWIILQHVGTIEVESQINQGTKMTVFLPVQNKG
ncbi:HAMP domain-containing sensor histidine kinase [Desulforamulus ruminis]